MICFAGERSVIVKEKQVAIKGREKNEITDVEETDAERQFDDSRLERQATKV